MERTGGGGCAEGTDTGAADAADNTTMTTTRELCSESNNNNLVLLGPKARSKGGGYVDGDVPPKLGAASQATTNKERGHQSLMETILAQKMAQEGRQHRRVRLSGFAGTTTLLVPLNETFGFGDFFTLLSISTMPKFTPNHQQTPLVVVPNDLRDLAARR